MTLQSLLSTPVSHAQMVALDAPGTDTVMSLENRLLQSFAASAVEADQRVATIESMLRRDDIGDPEQLASLQLRSSEYNVDVSMINTLVRKGVSTVETLLRSS